ncbi:MAG: RNase adapter RapZ [Thiomargarita sp.]|nr:RNase adapter RapZ [Thiomargarita sp.]
MKLIIITGLSGAGKSIALHSLEDMGAYCIDNLPIELLSVFAEKHPKKFGITQDFVVLGIDARTMQTTLLQELGHTKIPSQVIYLEAEDAVLIKRFSETRRKHPLTTQDISLAEAIKRERELLNPLAKIADIRLNTSQMHVHQLRDMIRVQVGLCQTQGLSLLFQSFGFKYGVPTDANFVFDVRCLPNPHWNSALTHLTGQEDDVIHFLQGQSKVVEMREHLIHFLETWIPQFKAENRSYLTVAIGCTGGQHRSVYLAEQLAHHFDKQESSVLVQHRELLI